MFVMFFMNNLQPIYNKQLNRHQTIVSITKKRGEKNNQTSNLGLFHCLQQLPFSNNDSRLQMSIIN